MFLVIMVCLILSSTILSLMIEHNYTISLQDTTQMYIFGQNTKQMKLKWGNLLIYSSSSKNVNNIQASLKCVHLFSRRRLHNVVSV